MTLPTAQLGVETPHAHRGVESPPTRLRHAVGYGTVVAMMPYLSIKVAWLLGSDIGVTVPGLMRTRAFVVGNSLTGAMEVVGAALALALVHEWGRRMPAWLVLFPLWVAGGLLGPVMLAAPLGFVAESLSDGPATGGTKAAGTPIDGLQGWVYAVVYTGFILQGTGLAAAFALHLRVRWADVFRVRLGPAASPGDPLRDRTVHSRTHSVQVMATVAVGGLVALVVAVRLYWAFGGHAGLVNAEQSLPQRALDASSAGLALAGLLSLSLLVSRRPRSVRTWGPLAAAWLGTGAMFCSGTYQLLILLAPGTPFEAADDGGYGLILIAQTFAGLLGGTTVAVHLADNLVPSPTT